VRTSIEIPDELMAKALELTGLPSKRAAVEEGLRLLVQRAYRRQMLEAAGEPEYRWEGNLDQMRGRSNRRP
jgi:Arc/MetJ family transcription regulator